MDDVLQVLHLPDYIREADRLIFKRASGKANVAPQSSAADVWFASSRTVTGALARRHRRHRRCLVAKVVDFEWFRTEFETVLKRTIDRMARSG